MANTPDVIRLPGLLSRCGFYFTNIFAVMSKFNQLFRLKRNVGFSMNHIVFKMALANIKYRFQQLNFSANC